MTAPKPRQGHFMGQPIINQTFPDATWLEGEEFCYPHGGMTRRAYATCDDQVPRVFIAGLADTYFSIPARGRIKGRHVKGFLSASETGLKFSEIKRQNA